MIKQIIKSVLSTLGIKKDRHASSLLSLESALTRICKKEIQVHTVIDIGASDGRWTKQVNPYFPDAFYYLIEANHFHSKSLEKIKSSTNNIDFVIAAAGDRDGEIYFDASDPFGGLALYTPSSSSDIKVPVVTVDSICQKHNLKSPFLIKLDTHGFEVPIFEGATETLKNTNLLVVETYNFDIAEKSLRFYQICEYLEAKGFRCIDICEPLFRKRDDALWQFDLFFVRDNHSVFSCNSWD
jgi:FkbM family methyltransferase